MHLLQKADIWSQLDMGCLNHLEQSNYIFKFKLFRINWLAFSQLNELNYLFHGGSPINGSNYIGGVFKQVKKTT